MPRVTFLRDFDCSAGPRVVIAYKAGFSGLILTAHAERARAAGVLAHDEKRSAPPRQADENPDRGEGIRRD
jgi:hypothetical protein